MMRSNIFDLITKQHGVTSVDPVDDLKKCINRIKRIEVEYQTQLLWKEDELDGSALINKIKSRIISLESRNAVQTIYIQTTNKKGDIITEEHGYQISSTSQKNTEYERVIGNIIKKDEVIKQVEDFISCFNRLDKLSRIIIYYSFFKKESALKISQMRLEGALKYAARSVLRKRSESVNLLVKMLRYVERLKVQ